MSEPLSFRQALLWCLPAYLLSRLALQGFDLQFDLSAMARSWQFLDLSLLKDQLWHSLWFQHSQPPLLNLWTGLSLSLPASFRAGVIQAQFLLFSLLTMSAIFWLLRTHGVRHWLSYSMALLFIVSPEAILYEHWFFYTWPVAAGLILCACCLQLYHLHQQIRFLALFCIILTAIILTRSMFHLIFLVPVSLLLWFGVRASQRRQLIGLLALTMCISALPYAKNQLVFGFFGGSSWSGMSLWRIVNLYDEAAPLVPNSPVATITPFAPISEYADVQTLDADQVRTQPEAAEPRQPLIAIPTRFEQHTVLTAPLKTGGATNYNHIGYLQLAGAYQEAAITAIKAEPLMYLKHILRAWAKYTEGSWQYFFLRDNQLKLMPWIESFTQVSTLLWLEREVFGWHQDWIYGYPVLLCLSMLIAMLLVTGYGAIRGWLCWHGQAARSASLVPGFMLMTIWYVALLGNMMEYGENNRFRVQTDPLLYTLLCLTLISIKQRLWPSARKAQKQSGQQARVTPP